MSYSDSFLMDRHFETAREHRRNARLSLKFGLPRDHKWHMGEAIRHWKLYRKYREMATPERRMAA